MSWKINYMSFSLESLFPFDVPPSKNYTMLRAEVSHDSSAESPRAGYVVVWISWAFFAFSEKMSENEEEQQSITVDSLLLIVCVTWKFWKRIFKYALIFEGLGYVRWKETILSRESLHCAGQPERRQMLSGLWNNILGIGQTFWLNFCTSGRNGLLCRDFCSFWPSNTCFICYLSYKKHILVVSK